MHVMPLLLQFMVAELQAQIARERDVPVEQQRIIYKGRRGE